MTDQNKPVVTEKSVSENSRRHFKYRSETCLNCNHPLDLSDRFCAYCGQLNTTKSLSLKDFFSEFLGSIIAYDSRLRFTLRDLLFKPGVITKNYVNGQRLKYANPFRFFLSVSIVYFIVQSTIIWYTDDGSNFYKEVKKESGPVVKLSTNDGFNYNLINTDSLEENIESNVEPIPETANTTQYLASNTPSDSSKTKYKTPTKAPLPSYTLIAEDSLNKFSWSKENIERTKLYYNFYKTTSIESSAQALDSMGHKNTRYHRWIYSKIPVFEQVKKNPGDFGRFLLGKIPFFLFFFTPFYALFFWLIYSKKRHTYMEHMVFIFHIFSFVFLGMLICSIPDLFIGGDRLFASIFLTFIGPFYFYKALRNFYKEKRWLTIVKFIFLNNVFFISASFSAVLFLLISVALY